jgi:hypothetical protein
MPPRRARLARPIAGLVLLTFLGACVSTATIKRRSGPTIEACIDRSDQDKVYVSATDGKHYAVDRSDMIDVDHPGNVLMTTGLVISSFALLMLVSGILAVKSANPQGSGEDRFGGYLNIWMGGGTLVWALPMALFGGFQWSDSQNALVPKTPTQAMRESLPRLTCSFCPQ